jgi:DUF4097 and DUF4098 domain-containing protein YvlB
MTTMTHARALVALAVAAAVAAPAAAQTRPDPNSRPQPRVRVERDRDRGPEHVERFSRKVRLGENGAFELSNIAGDIVVTGGGGGDVTIEAVKRARSRSEEDAKRQLSLIDIRVQEGAQRVDVRTIHSNRSRNSSVTVDYTIALPAGARVTLTSISGDVSVTGVRGELRAQTISGDVRIDAGSRQIWTKSVSGDVEIVSTGQDAEVTASTMSGSVTARNLRLRTFEGSSVSGSVGLERVSCVRAEMKSISGTLTYSGTLSKGGRYELNSHSGDVRLTLEGSTGFELEATSYSGGVRSDLPITLQGPEPSESRRGRGHMNRSIRGRFGDGSAYLEVTTFSGDIAISRR